MAGVVRAASGRRRIGATAFPAAGATRLFLGFADGYQFGDPAGDPGYYGDNLGELSAIFDVRMASPTTARGTTWGRLKTMYR